MTQEFRLTVIMPCYGNVDYTLKAIKSLKDKQAYDNYYILVENHPDLETLTVVPARIKNVSAYTAAENLGVAKSWDTGIKLAPTDFVAVVNNDIEMLTDNWDLRLLEIMRELNAAIICPWPYHPSAVPDTVQQGYNKGLNGSFFLFNKKTIEETDNFKNRGEYIDTGYERAYWEDVDLLIQIRKLGLESYVTAKVQQIHHGNTTAGAMFPGGIGKDMNNPYWKNLDYLNKKYNVNIWDYFKVDMSNVMHEETNKRLI